MGKVCEKFQKAMKMRGKTRKYAEKYRNNPEIHRIMQHALRFGIME